MSSLTSNYIWYTIKITVIDCLDIAFTVLRFSKWWINPFFAAPSSRERISVKFHMMFLYVLSKRIPNFGVASFSSFLKIYRWLKSPVGEKWVNPTYSEKSSYLFWIPGQCSNFVQGKLVGIFHPWCIGKFF